MSPYYKARWSLAHTLKDQTVDSFNKQIISILNQTKTQYCLTRETGSKKQKVHYHLFYEYIEDCPEDSINELIRKTFRKGKSAYMHKQYTLDEINEHSPDWYLGYVVKDMNIIASTYTPPRS